MALSDMVANFLLSNDASVTFALGKLDFTFDSFRVDYEGYREIGHKIRQGAIEVAEASASSGSQIAAVYTAQRDRLSVPANLDLSGRGRGSIGQQAMIVHECTHALMDFHYYQTTGAVQEACAYIAESIYATCKLIGLSGGGNTQSQAILDAASAIVTGRSMHRNPEYWGMSIGTQLMDAILDLADNWLNLKRVELEVNTDNPAGVRLYEKSGFVIEGTKRFHTYGDGRWADSYFMARVRD
jgi:GNAT superfamily N-acetyltransferase